MCPHALRLVGLSALVQAAPMPYTTCTLPYTTCTHALHHLHPALHHLFPKVQARCKLSLILIMVRVGAQGGRLGVSWCVTP